MLRNDYPVPRGRLLNKVMMNGQWLDPDDIRELVQKNQLWANLGFGQEGYNARGVGPGEGDHVVAEATGTLARTRDRLGLDAVPLQRSNDNWNDERDARHQSRLDDIERRTRYQDELTNIYLDRERHRLARMQKDDDEWTDTFNAMRDRIRHRSNSQFGRENDPRLSVAETQERKVDAKGRTQQQWIQAVKAKFPDAKIIQAKMIDGPSHALLSDGRKIVWNPVQDVAETGASFRAGNARRAAVNAMSPEERRAYDEKRAEQQRKRDEARMERERQRNAAKKDVAEGFDRLDSFTRKVLNRMEDDSWLSAERAYFIQKGAQEKAQTNREQYNQEIQRFIDLYRQYKGQLGVAEGIFGSKKPQEEYDIYLKGYDPHAVKKYLLSKFGSKGWRVFAANDGSGTVSAHINTGLYPSEIEARVDLQKNCKPQGVAESSPYDYDSDEDYYASLRRPKPKRSADDYDDAEIGRAHV